MSEKMLSTPSASDATSGGGLDRHASTAADVKNLRPQGSDPGPFPWGPYAAAIERWEAIHGPAPHPVDERNRLSPAFVEWMQGFPPGWTEGMSRTAALKALGNAVVPQQAILALDLLMETP